MSPAGVHFRREEFLIPFFIVGTIVLTGSESNETLKSRGLGKFDLVAAIVIFALAIALLVEGSHAAAAAVREYGRNVDSGVYESAIAVLVLFPMALGFLVASILRRKKPGLAVGVRVFSVAWPLVLVWLGFLASQPGGGLWMALLGPVQLP